MQSRNRKERDRRNAAGIGKEGEGSLIKTIIERRAQGGKESNRVGVDLMQEVAKGQSSEREWGKRGREM